MACKLCNQTFIGGSKGSGFCSPCHLDHSLKCNEPEPLYRWIRDHDISLIGGKKDYLKQRADCLIQELGVRVCFFLHPITLQKYFNVLSNFSSREVLRNKSKLIWQSSHKGLEKRDEMVHYMWQKSKRTHG